MLNSEHFVKDSILEGMSEAQKINGKLPTPSDNEGLLVPILEEFSQEQKDIKSAPVVDARDTEAQMTDEAKRRSPSGHDLGAFKITHKASPWDGIFVTKTMGILERRMRARLRFLRGLPEWENKIKAINPLVLTGQLGTEKKREADRYLKKVLHEADIKFGDWWRAPPAAPVYSLPNKP